MPWKRKQEQYPRQDVLNDYKSGFPRWLPPVPSPSGGFDPYEVFIPLSGSGTLELFNVFKGLKGAIPWVRIPRSPPAPKLLFLLAFCQFDARIRPVVSGTCRQYRITGWDGETKWSRIMRSQSENISVGQFFWYHSEGSFDGCFKQRFHGSISLVLSPSGARNLVTGKVRSGLRYMGAPAVPALPSIGVRSNLKSGIVRGGRSGGTIWEIPG